MKQVEGLNQEKKYITLVERCYDDYCFYNQMNLIERRRFVSAQMEGIKADELIIPYLPLYLTTKCTLNCESCNNLMPMFHGRAFDFSWDKTKNALLQVLSQIKEMIFCELVGGEPFLNAQFEEVLDFVIAQPKIRQVVIVTNGTVIPSDSVIKKLVDGRVLVRISDYGMFDKMSKLVSKLDSAGVNVRIQQDMKWNNPGNTRPRGKSKEELYEQYNRCEFSMKCKYLCEDKLFTCARAASLYHLGITDADGDVLTITENTTKNILKEFYLQDFGAICDYCDLWSGYGGEVIPAAIQVGEKQITHSRYTIISNYELNHFKQMTKKYERLLKENGELNG